ncbi:putative gdsl lipase acylhydrolase family protein [Neofusicoccum parvum]|uniref:Gdsl lipase acylhydrolase family protein n=2 Tax=Neofusicoccum parvum TaxID=310453 RepID=A0ACB5S259_9PEZI|nr:putative gdsl lipase acylhydrolase family protein [Neofusicoccum parvum UCRNP2]GME26798.1 putative gdsl lipase acylhydrolase family protein [Neofusicoccum parvum]GME63183.1 putative gdsl lipase acylhydrolase family protein [Neofusicoccum parvum]
MAALYEQILLFGDSITQASNEQDGFGFAAPLQQAYARRLDVVNRGFNGYNTEKALQVLPRFMPSPGQAKTVFFGANDACVEGGSNNQHVCLEQYMENLRTICSHETVQAHSPRLLIITPPPVNEYKMEPVDIAKGHNGLQRTAELTKMYANAARKVGEELRIPVLDLWTIFMTRAGWVAGEPLPGCRAVDRNALIEELMYDGLHLTPSAYKIVMEELMSLIASAYPDMVPDRLPFALPAWNDGDGWKKL